MGNSTSPRKKKHCARALLLFETDRSPANGKCRFLCFLHPSNPSSSPSGALTPVPTIRRFLPSAPPSPSRDRFFTFARPAPQPPTRPRDRFLAGRAPRAPPALPASPSPRDPRRPRRRALRPVRAQAIFESPAPRGDACPRTARERCGRARGALRARARARGRPSRPSPSPHRLAPAPAARSAGRGVIAASGRRNAPPSYAVHPHTSDVPAQRLPLRRSRAAHACVRGSGARLFAIPARAAEPRPARSGHVGFPGKPRRALGPGARGSRERPERGARRREDDGRVVKEECWTRTARAFARMHLRRSERETDEVLAICCRRCALREREQETGGGGIRGSGNVLGAFRNKERTRGEKKRNCYWLFRTLDLLLGIHRSSRPRVPTARKHRG